MKIIRKFFSVTGMVKQEYILGDLVGSKEAYRNLLKIAIPAIIEMVFVSLIGSVDVVMVGRLGFEAIAAVGLATQPRYILLSVFLALNVGITAIVARRKGEGRPEAAALALRNSLVIVLGLTAVVTVVAIVFSRRIVLISGAQHDTVDMADDYFRIMAYFLPVSTITMCINAAQRGVGNTRITMIANVAANIVNVFFNYLLIFGNWGFPMLGVAGAAWASGIGLCVGLGISVFSLFRDKGAGNFLRISIFDNWRLDRNTVRSIVNIGGNSVLEQVAQRFGLFVYSVIIAGIGTAAFAAHQVGMQFLSFSFNFGSGLAAASVTLVGQMLGQKRADLAIIYGKCSQRLALFISVALASSMILFRGPLVSLFLLRNDPANILSFGMAVNLMFIVAMFQPPQTSCVVYAGCLRGAGDNLFVAVTMIICVAIFRPLFSALAVYVFHFGIIGAWAIALVDICLRLVFLYSRFSSSKWHALTV